MAGRLLNTAALIVVATACSSGFEDITPTREPIDVSSGASGPDVRFAVAAMTFWLENFRTEQRRFREMTGRFADEVTIEGAVQQLPPPYQTSYSVHGLGKRYAVEIRFPDGRQTCKLEDGDGAQNPGKVDCVRQ